MTALRRGREWLASCKPPQILLGALSVFWVYCWPGFIGWDTREHLLQSRAGHYTDGHPPAVARLVRLGELFLSGPLAMMLVQSITLILGLYWLLRSRMSDRAAAWCAAVIFLFPPIAGVQALIAKDGLMAGFLMIGIAMMLGRDRARPVVALVFIGLASLMRWNALAATFAPMLLLFRWNFMITGAKRYAIALLAWLAITGVAYQINEVLTDEEEHLWYWSYAYEDIAGTLEHAGPFDDAQMEQFLAGVPLRVHDRLFERFHAVYYPLNFYHLMRGEQRLLEIPRSDAERAAVKDAWHRLVYGYPRAYAAYRWENFRVLTNIERPPSMSNVYVWFTVIAAPETIAELQHDAGPSRVQARMRDASIAISLSPLYWVFLYFAAAVVLLALNLRRALEASLLLSAIGYELQWFFLAATADYRYSQWMILCVCVASALGLMSVRQRRASRRTG